MSTYEVWECFQTSPVLYANSLYADSVCRLPARMEKNRQSLQVWICRCAVHVHFLQCVISLFVELEQLTTDQMKEFLLLLKICSPVHVYGMCVMHTTKTVIKRLMHCFSCKKILNQYYCSWEKKNCQTGKSTKKLYHPWRVCLHRRNQLGLHIKL